MNSRTTSTPLGQRTRWWGKTALLVAALAIGGTLSAQVATGYTFAQSAGAYTPITGGTVLVAQTNNTTSNAGSLDDGTTYLAPMPFTFTYDGVGYTTCTVSNNGAVSFGGTPITATTYAAILGAGTYSAAVAAYSRDLQGGFIFAGTRTLASATITAASNTDGVTVGSIISGTGIPAGATVLSKTATTVVMSAAATATSTGTACWVWNGEMRFETLGSPGSYIHVIQWSNMKPFGTTLTTTSGFRMNMQVRLFEATGKIEVVYGDCANVNVTSTGTGQVGLRGPTNLFATNVNNRQVVKGASTWGATAAGILNTSGCIFNSSAPADVITSGLTFAWTPLVCSGSPVGGTAAFSGSGSPACANTTRVMTCTGQSAVISGISYAWQVGAAPGGPYVPVSGGSGATTATYTTGPLAAGTYYYVMTTTCSNTPASTNSTELTLVVNPSPTAVITMAPVNGVICGTGSVALTASGGATYAWSPATGLDAVTGATVNSTTTQTRIYTVVADDGAGCTDSETATVTVAAAMPAPTASISPNPICPGATASLTSSVTYGGYTMTTGGSSFIDISVTGTSVGTISDDSEHFITIPSFTFNGIAYTNATVGNNGAMSFGAPVNTAIHYTNLALPAAVSATNGAGFGTPSNIAICPWWDDFTPGTGSSVRTQTVGGLFIIQWTNEDHFAAPGTGVVTFQAQLELATGNIYFCYSDVNFTGTAAQDQGGEGTVGLNFGATAQQWNFNSKVLFDGQVIAFIKNTVSYGWTGPNAYTDATQNPSRLNCQVADEGVYVVTATAQNGCSNTGNTLALDVDDTDTDGDLTADCNDGCPLDPLKIAPGICGCGVADTDTDGDLTADCIDGCPADPLKIAPGICGCGVADTDTDGDLTADCIDGCPADPLKIAPGICGCGVADTDTDGDLTADCIDGCPADPLKIAPGICGCGVADTDTDGDLVADCIDNCPLVVGQIGSPCDDNNCFTTGDVLNGSCVCAGVLVPCDNWTLTIDAGTNGGDISWTMIEDGGPCVLQSGGPYASNQTHNVTVCVPQGNCFNLTFTDASNNGITGGGWKLVDNLGRRILDNVGNGGCFATTSTTAEAFCNEPSSTQTVIATHCDKENWLITDVIIASANTAVSAQYGIGDQTDDGYQFWFQNPCGGYNRKIFRNHATSGGQGPANAVRATKLGLSTMVTNPLPINTLLNVRVRNRVNGANSAWGPACRFQVNPAACTITQLNQYIASPNYSCGVTGKVVGASGNTGKIFANVVTSGGNPATNYRFEFSVIGEGYLRNLGSTNAVCVLGVWATNPLLCGTYTYDVRVQASFDGGATYCPFGPVCTVGITNSQPSPFCTPTNAAMAPQEDGIDNFDAGDFAMYPNPNRGDQLFMNMSGFDATVSVVTVEIYDSFGKRAMTATLPVQDGMLNTVLALTPDMAAGLYMVNVTAGDITKTERLVIQR